MVGLRERALPRVGVRPAVGGGRKFMRGMKKIGLAVGCSLVASLALGCSSAPEGDVAAGAESPLVSTPDSDVREPVTLDRCGANRRERGAAVEKIYEGAVAAGLGWGGVYPMPRATGRVVRVPGKEDEVECTYATTCYWRERELVVDGAGVWLGDWPNSCIKGTLSIGSEPLWSLRWGPSASLGDPGIASTTQTFPLADGQVPTDFASFCMAGWNVRDERRGGAVIGELTAQCGQRSSLEYLNDVTCCTEAAGPAAPAAKASRE